MTIGRTARGPIESVAETPGERTARRQTRERKVGDIMVEFSDKKYLRLLGPLVA